MFVKELFRVTVCVCRLKEELPGTEQRWEWFQKCLQTDSVEKVKDCIRQTKLALSRPGYKIQYMFRPFIVTATTVNANVATNTDSNGNLVFNVSDPPQFIGICCWQFWICLSVCVTSTTNICVLFAGILVQNPSTALVPTGFSTSNGNMALSINARKIEYVLTSNFGMIHLATPFEIQYDDPPVEIHVSLFLQMFVSV